VEAFSVDELVRAVNGRRDVGDGSHAEGAGPIRAVCTDSRAVVPGTVFFAIRGERFDGHAFVAAALEGGACCAVACEDAEGVPTDETTAGRVIRVADTRRALGDLARWYRQRMGFRVVAITGSAGKTTTRQIVHHVLSRHMRCHQAEKSFNNDIGVPLTLLAGGRDDAAVIAELGANAPGEIRYLSGIAEPDVALVTTVLPAHLEGFGSLEAIVAEKASIAEGLRPGGVLVVNGDVPELVAHCRRRGWAFETFGTGADCVVRGDRLETDGMRGRLVIESVDVEVPLAGRGNLENVLAAWAVCRRFGVGIRAFAEAVASFEAPTMRLRVETVGPLTVLNDCYNANPGSMANALDCLYRVGERTGRRRVFVCGTMAELGAAAERLHDELGCRAADAGVGTLLAVGEFAGAVERGFRRGVGPSGSADAAMSACFETTEGLCDNLEGFIRPDDIVLVKGSRCMGLERAVERLWGLFGGSMSGDDPAGMATGGPRARHDER